MGAGVVGDVEVEVEGGLLMGVIVDDMGDVEGEDSVGVEECFGASLPLHAASTVNSANVPASTHNNRCRDTAAVLAPLLAS